MLSGKVPFQVSNDPKSAMNVVQRIQDGQFSLSGPEWVGVSPAAKQIIQGELDIFTPIFSIKGNIILLLLYTVVVL